jgi:hypothetical protein
MKKYYYLIGLLFGVFVSHAQTGIGTTSPDASAKLEISATNKGFLPPRVALTATNSASPISSPANGLMVFNTVTAGTNPFQVVPGYYYWDGTGQKWVSLSTTVGNVMNQSIFRSNANTNAGSAITSWDTRFNNIASGDLTVTSLTTFTLSNGIYKIEWALPYQSANTYNSMQLQEFSSGSWNAFRGDGAYSNLSNGGNTDWGGGTYAADILDCSTSSKTIRIINNDGASRTLFKGVSLIITKLNPSITTSTTADNLGNHTATSNLLLNGNYLSNDGGNEGVSVDNAGNVGIGTNVPTNKLHVVDNSSTGWSGILTLDGNVATSGVSLNMRNNNDVEWHLDNAGSASSTPNTINLWNNVSNSTVFTMGTDGQLKLNTTGNNSLMITANTSDNNGMFIMNANTANNWGNNWHEFLLFQKQGTTIGAIIGASNGTAVNYNTTSDYRLKTDFKPFDGLSVINKIKTYDYAWKSDYSRMYGVKAHELQEVLPYLVTGEKDAMDAEGKIKAQMVDYSKLSPILIKAVQELDQQNKILKAANRKLEKRILHLEKQLIKNK